MNIFSEFFTHRTPPFGLDISDTSIEVVQLKRSGSTIALAQYGSQFLEDGLVRDGVILDPALLARHIDHAVRSTIPSAITHASVIVSLPESRVFTSTITLPATLRGEDLHIAVHHQAEESIPLSRSEMYDDWLVIRDETTRDTQEIFYCGSPRSTVDALLETLRLGHLEPVALDLESLSLTRSLVPSYNNNEGVFVVDIGGRSTILSITDRGGIRASATLKVAGNAFTDDIARELNIEHNEAERIKKVEGMNTQQKEGKVQSVLKQSISPIIAEAQQLMEYYEKKSGRSVVSIVLAGGSSSLPGLVTYCQKQWNRSVRRGNVCETVLACQDIIQDRDPILLSTVVGLALRGLAPNPAQAGINLIPHQRSLHS